MTHTDSHIYRTGMSGSDSALSTRLNAENINSMCKCISRLFLGQDAFLTAARDILRTARTDFRFHLQISAIPRKKHCTSPLLPCSPYIPSTTTANAENASRYPRSIVHIFCFRRVPGSIRQRYSSQRSTCTNVQSDGNETVEPGQYVLVYIRYFWFNSAISASESS